MMSRTDRRRAMAAGARAGAPIFPVQNTVPTRYPPIATWGLIAANCAVFLFQISLSPRDLDLFLDRFALIPAQYFQSAAYGGQPLTLGDYLPFATNMFLHGGWLHLILNMWTLWMFGPPIEDRLGHTRYLLSLRPGRVSSADMPQEARQGSCTECRNASIFWNCSSVSTPDQFGMPLSTRPRVTVVMKSRSHSSP
jgi:hypothetical protein